LEDVLSSELSGKFKTLAKKLSMTPWEVMAKALYKAMQGPGTKERVLIEVLATCSNDDIVELKKSYQLVLEADGKSKGNLPYCLLSTCFNLVVMF
uniref:Annexin n=1 Tax=Schistocephalus solidus TaxID=70667 RepID=A0A183SCH9_SCHSO